MDWKDSLASLMSELPQDNRTESHDSENTQETGNATEKARLDIMLDKKGRKGKAATIICGFTINDNAIEDIAGQLKKRLGTGGSARGGEILVQGDKRHEVEAALKAMGIKCRII